MTPAPLFTPDPKLDLVLERVVDVPREKLYTCWTTPKHLTPWFTPDPWKTIACEIDLRPGGAFKTVFKSPEGQEIPNVGTFLEIVPNERIVWTDAVQPGFRPTSKVGFPTGAGFQFSCVLTFTPEAGGTRYKAVAIHGDEEARKSHEAMGFHTGWGAVLDQLVEYAKKNV